MNKLKRRPWIRSPEERAYKHKVNKVKHFLLQSHMRSTSKMFFSLLGTAKEQGISLDKFADKLVRELADDLIASGKSPRVEIELVMVGKKDVEHAADK